MEERNCKYCLYGGRCASPEAPEPFKSLCIGKEGCGEYEKVSLREAERETLIANIMADLEQDMYGFEGFIMECVRICLENREQWSDESLVGWNSEDERE